MIKGKCNRRFLLCFVCLLMLFGVCFQPAPVQAKTIANCKSVQHWSYKNKKVKIRIDKVWYKNSWVYAAHVKTKNYRKIGTSSANGEYGKGYETTSHAARRLKAILCINGDYSHKSLHYTTVRSGKVAHNGGIYNGFYSKWDGKLGTVNELRQDLMNDKEKSVCGVKAKKAVKQKLVSDTFNFAPPILMKKKILCGKGGSRRQRTFIGSNGKAGDLWLVVADGQYSNGVRNDGVSVGLTGYDCAKFLKKLGCKTGLMLDGGGSSTMVFKNRVLNAARYNEREVVDFVYVRK